MCNATTYYRHLSFNPGRASNGRVQFFVCVCGFPLTFMPFLLAQTRADAHVNVNRTLCKRETGRLTSCVLCRTTVATKTSEDVLNSTKQRKRNQRYNGSIPEDLWRFGLKWDNLAKKKIKIWILRDEWSQPVQVAVKFTVGPIRSGPPYWLLEISRPDCASSI